MKVEIEDQTAKIFLVSLATAYFAHNAISKNISSITKNFLFLEMIEVLKNNKRRISLFHILTQKNLWLSIVRVFPRHPVCI